MSKENNCHTFEGCEPSTLFREFAAECMELAQTTPTPEKRALYVKMASVWHQMAQRWEKKGQPGRCSAAKLLQRQTLCSALDHRIGDPILVHIVILERTITANALTWINK